MPPASFTSPCVSCSKSPGPQRHGCRAPTGLESLFRRSHPLTDALELLAVLASTLFAGASIYINLVEHPARLSCGTELAARQWAPSYKRATVMQVTLAVLATIAGVARGMSGGGTAWYIGASLIFAVIPFTALVVIPTNNRLLAPGRDLGSSETRHLLENWGRLHAVRSVLSLIASLVFISTAG